jgi:SNF2 family DNA or RNA helicase
VTDEFLRIVLDEAHNIKNRTALVSKACYELKGQRRWALTGTFYVEDAQGRLTSAKVPL